VIGSQYLCFAFLIITIALWLLAQAALAGSTPEPLLAVARFAVLVHLATAAVITLHNLTFYQRSPR
jgi:hypothetical protein